MTKNTTLPADTRYAKSESIPRSLRHIDDAHVIGEVFCLVCFLQDAVDSIFSNGNSTEASTQEGLYLCFDLLRDKIAIARGDLSFPMVDRSQDDELPPLWARPRKEANNA